MIIFRIGVGGCRRGRRQTHRDPKVADVVGIGGREVNGCLEQAQRLLVPPRVRLRRDNRHDDTALVIKRNQL
jgi:hypothetical protein